MSRAYRYFTISLAVVAFLSFLVPLGSEQRTRIILLGTGTPPPDPDRQGQSTAIVVDGHPYLVDLGVGVMRRAVEAEIDLTQIRQAFVTHLHSDHTLGYPDLIFTTWIARRSHTIDVYGPPGLEKMTDHILSAWAEDIDIRINGLQAADPAGYVVNPHEISPGVVFQDERVKVIAFRVPHGSWEHAFGFKFETPDRTIVLSGDTAYSEELIRMARGVDVLIHEVYAEGSRNERVSDWDGYRKTFHTSTSELAKIANQARPGLLLLSHHMPMGVPEEQMLKEITDKYDGKVVIGRDLGVY